MDLQKNQFTPLTLQKTSAYAQGAVNVMGEWGDKLILCVGDEEVRMRLENESGTGGTSDSLLLRYALIDKKDYTANLPNYQQIQETAN